jgi:uncharacterized protein (DUF2141 family)
VIALLAPVALAEDLVVEVTGLRNTEGTLQLALFATAAGYPEESARAVHTRSVPADATTLTVRFDAIGQGPWALAVLHDENGNAVLDRNLLGIPREGIGASNRATDRLGVPRFEDARFTLPPDGLRLAVALRYY